MENNLYLYGASGHCKVIIDILKSKDENVISIFDDAPKVKQLFQVPVLHSDTCRDFPKKKMIISIGDNAIRKRISQQIKADFQIAIHEKAIVSADVTIGAGTVAMAGAVINHSTSIGQHCIINSGAVVEHDCVIQDYVHISPNVSLAGNVCIGEGTQVGIGASVIQGVKIGKWVMIGAGSVILNDIPDYAVVVGNPGKIIKYLKKMNTTKIWLSSPHMGGTEQQYVQEAFDNNWIAPLGPNVNGLEIDLQEYLGNDSHVGALSSGTAAIHLGLILLGVEAGDTVICQSMTFSASANPILYLGAMPIFVDSETQTWNLCPITLEEAIVDSIAKGCKPKAIIAVHLYGVPYQIEAIKAISEAYGIPVLEDSAEALGSSYKGQKCGTFGDIGVLSFNGNKIITTSGGGALVANNQIIKNKAVFLATQSRDDAPHYEHTEIGYNYRMSNICAGIGRGQMEVLDAHVALRRRMHDFYMGLFKDIDGVTVFKSPTKDFFANYWLSAILISNEAAHGVTNETLRLALEAENIESRPLWKPMHLQPIFSAYPYYGNRVAESLFETGLCLPSGSNLTNEDRARIAAVIAKVFNSKPNTEILENYTTVNKK